MITHGILFDPKDVFNVSYSSDIPLHHSDWSAIQSYWKTSKTHLAGDAQEDKVVMHLCALVEVLTNQSVARWT